MDQSFRLCTEKGFEMILVVGATGNLGGAICEMLVERGKTIRALVRPTSDNAKVAHLREMGIQTKEADLKERQTLGAVCQGVETVITTVTTVASRQPGDSIETVDRDGNIRLIDAARDAGVRHFIFISFSGNLDREQVAPLTVAKRSVERRVRESGLMYTILRPSAFMEFWLGPITGFDYMNAKAMIYGDGTKPISYIALPDVVRFTVESVDNKMARNAVLELGGPAPVSPLEAVRIFEQVGGRKFELQYVPMDALEAGVDAAQDSLSRSMAVLSLAMAKGDAIDMSGVMRDFQLPLTSVRQYAEHVLHREPAH
jgi:uncharacterized protein YbjT (DUF2867 family)